MESYQGQLLIASLQLEDPNFIQTVSLIVQHGNEGALGLVLNRQTGKSTMEIWDQLSDTPCGNDLPVYLGGPVPGPLMSLHSNMQYAEMQILPDVFFATRREHLDHLVNLTDEDDPAVKIFIGHAGWGAGQLEEEIEQGSWHLIPATSDIIFDDGISMWRNAMKRYGRKSFMGMLGVAQYPDDPSVN